VKVPDEKQSHNLYEAGWGKELCGRKEGGRKALIETCQGLLN